MGSTCRVEEKKQVYSELFYFLWARLSRLLFCHLMEFQLNKVFSRVFPFFMQKIVQRDRNL